LQQRLDRRRHTVEQVFAVVDDDQCRHVAELLGERVEQRPTELLTEPEHCSDRLRNEIAAGDRRQLHAPDAVVVPIELQLQGGDLVRQPRLAATSGTGEADQAVGDDRLAYRCHLRLAPDERRQLRRQVRRSIYPGAGRT